MGHIILDIAEKASQLCDFGVNAHSNLVKLVFYCPRNCSWVWATKGLQFLELDNIVLVVKLPSWVDYNLMLCKNWFLLLLTLN